MTADQSGSTRVRVGVIGLGLIAQVVHLPNLVRLADLFSIAQVCDLSEALCEVIAAQLPGRARATRDWRAVVEDEDVDAVMILTPGAHAPLAAAALEAGKHVFSEKPLGVTQGELSDLATTARRHGRVLQVGYMKMHDPLITPARDALAGIGEPRLIRVTVLHPSEERQIAHLRVHRYRDADPQTIADARAAEDAAIRTAIGDAGDDLVRLYRDVLLGSVIHELSLLRALGIELPHTFDQAFAWRPTGVPVEEPASFVAHAALSGGARLEVEWLWLPDYPSYREEVAIHGTTGSLLLRMPPPYSPASGAVLESWSEVAGRPTRSWTQDERDSGFLAELRAFHASVTEGIPVLADADVAREDTAALQALAAAVARSRGAQLGGEAAAA